MNRTALQKLVATGQLPIQAQPAWTADRRSHELHCTAEAGRDRAVADAAASGSDTRADQSATIWVTAPQKLARQGSRRAICARQLLAWCNTCGRIRCRHRSTQHCTLWQYAQPSRVLPQAPLRVLKAPAATGRNSAAHPDRQRQHAQPSSAAVGAPLRLPKVHLLQPTYLTAQAHVGQRVTSATLAEALPPQQLHQCVTTQAAAASQARAGFVSGSAVSYRSPVADATVSP
jgi:hypothetical protein